jgi:hypothetical protein
MEYPEFTSKALATMAAAALIAMACVLWLIPARVETEVRPLQANPDLPTFKPVR